MIYVQEELALYRNGATNQDLMEIINEKENELSTTKLALTEKSESLRKLAKTSTGVLAECDRLNEMTRSLQADNKAFSEKLATKCSELDASKLKMQETTETLTDTEYQLAQVTGDYNAVMVDIEKLHQRVAQLVREKTEKSSALDEEKRLRASDVRALRVGVGSFLYAISSLYICMSLQNELDRAMAENTSLKQQITLLDTTNSSLLADLNDAKDVIKETRGVIKREQEEVATATKNFRDAEKSYKSRIAQVSTKPTHTIFPQH